MDPRSTNNKALLEAQDTKYLTKLLASAYKLEFAPDPFTMDALHQMYAPMRIEPGTGMPTDHPLAAAHQRIAQIEAYKYAKQHQPIIEIGPNAVNFMTIAQNNPQVHGCTMLSTRDQQRHTNAANSVKVRGCRDRNYTISVGRLARGIPDMKFCTRGWQNCKFQANHAIAVHSLYDVSLHELAAGMYNHNCLNIEAWMHFPMEALETDEWSNYQNAYHFQVVQRNGKKTINFSFLGDASFGYQHEYDTWMNYLKIGGIDTPYGFSLLIEKQYHKGSQWKLRISRVNIAGSFYYRIPTAFKTVCKVPDFHVMAKSAFTKHQPIVYINTDTKKIKKMLEFLSSRDGKGFTLETAKAYGRTLITEIRFDKRVVEYEWDISVKDFNKVCMAVFILATLEKRRETKILQLATKRMNDLDKDQAWYDRLVEKVGDTLSYCFDLFEREFNSLFEYAPSPPERGHGTKKREATALLHGDTKNIFARATIEFYQELQVENRVSDYSENILDFKIHPIPSEPEPYTAEELDKVNDNRMKEAMELQASAPPLDGEPNATIHLQDWTSEFGMNAKYPKMSDEQIQKEYESEDQHQTLITELDIQIAKCDADDSTDIDGQTANRLKDVLNDARKHFALNKPTKLHVENMALLQGGPGCGKTKLIVDDYVPSLLANKPTAKVLILTPTNALMKEYEAKMVAFSTNVRCMTIHKGIAFLEQIQPELVVIDEAFLLPLAFINHIASKHRVLLLGDPCQINHVDFLGQWGSATKLREVTHLMPTVVLSKSHRCPKDVLQINLIKTAYPGFFTKSHVTNSIEHMGPKFKNENAQVLCFTNDQAQRCQSNGETATTVHRAQGKTYTNVVMHYGGTIEEEKLLRSSPEHLVVALTRHTNKLYIRDLSTIGTGPSPGLTTYLNKDFPLTKFSETANLEPTTKDQFEVKKHEERRIAEKYEKTIPLEQDAEYPQCSATEKAVESILHSIYPVAPMLEFQSVITTELSPGEDAKGKLRLSELSKDKEYETKKHTVHKFIAGQRVKITRTNDQLMSLKSMLGRLTKKTINLPESQAKTEASRMFKEVEQHFNWEITDEDRNNCFMDAVERFQERGHDMTKLKDVTTWTERNVNLVKNHLKAQQKPYTDSDPLMKEKAGQGISAWDKTLNFEMCAYTRLLELVLVKRGTGKIKVMTGKSDTDIMIDLEQDNEPDDLFVENDWSEFDSSQNNLTRFILRKALLKLNIPKALLTNFMAMLTERRICDSFLTIMVNDKKDSGAPHTLIDNCLFNMAVCACIIKDYRVLYIKGDDSCARGKNVHFDQAEMLRLGGYGYKFKAFENPSGSFVSFIINNNGVAFDLPRICAKVLTRNYINKEDFDNYRDAIGVSLRHVRRDAGLNMVVVNALHYRKSTQQMDTLLSFLKKFATGEVPFSRTVAMESCQRIADPIDYGHTEILETKFTTQLPVKIPNTTTKDATSYRMVKKVLSAPIDLMMGSGRFFV
jgi:putative hemolysin